MPELHKVRKTCRICGSDKFESILNFGDIALTGVFLPNGADVEKAPLELIRCENCGLGQLKHIYASDALYGDSYGYESHLNPSMVSHLQSKARMLQGKFLSNIDAPIVVDIASNDGTLLAGYTKDDIQLVGIDPLIGVVSDFYPPKSAKIQSFFTKDAYFNKFSEKASLVTSLSVLYDLDSPVSFASEIYEILADEGIWHFEQSYLPTMVDTMSYDTICHEHSLYLRLEDIAKILELSNFKLVDVSLNSINGGSIAVTAIKTSNKVNMDPFVTHLLLKELALGYIDGTRLRKFAVDAREHSSSLQALISNYISEGFTIYGLGASTKGNALLQLCKIKKDDIKFIGDINPRKFGRQTPGSCIPIVNEVEVLGSTQSKKLAIVLPWHFRDGIVKKSERYLIDGGRLLFPLPQIEIV